jgi:titin
LWGFFAGKPSAPRNMHLLDQSKTSISIGWESPESDGGAPIVGYVIEKRESSRSTWTGMRNHSDIKYSVI